MNNSASTSAYWNEQAPWDQNETLRVRECKNGCKQVVYFNEHTGKFCNFNDGEQHDCPNFQKKSSSNSYTGSSQGNRTQSAQNNTGSPKPSNNTSGPVHQFPQTGLEVLFKGQLEEIRRAVDHLSRIAMFAESMDFRLKKIEEHYNLQYVPPRPDLTDKINQSAQQEAEEFPNDI